MSPKRIWHFQQRLKKVNEVRAARGFTMLESLGEIELRCPTSRWTETEDVPSWEDHRRQRKRAQNRASDKRRKLKRKAHDAGKPAKPPRPRIPEEERKRRATELRKKQDARHPGRRAESMRQLRRERAAAEGRTVRVQARRDDLSPRSGRMCPNHPERAVVTRGLCKGCYQRSLKTRKGSDLACAAA